MPTTFAQLGVPEFVCDALAARGINRPFDIQAAAIPDAMAGRDICGRAPTGSGKTLAFGIPLVVSTERAEPHRPHSLVLAPTRELAEQIAVDLRSFAGSVRIGVVYGGVGYGPQLAALRRGVDVLVACPGRLEDLIDQGRVDLGAVDRVVLDEADRMADMGFMPSVRRLLDRVADPCQTYLFSATLDGDVAHLIRDYQHDPVHHEVGDETPDVTSADHVFWKVDRHDRVTVAADAVKAAWPAIVFCRTRHGSDRVARQLGRAGVRAAAIHGGRSQSQRTRALAEFTEGRVQALVATDVAARGIHVDGVASVIHYDPPEDHKTYLHRSGRTARAGRGGVVISLVQPDQRKATDRVQRDVGLREPLTAPDVGQLNSLIPDTVRITTAGDEDERRKPSRSNGRGRPKGGGNRRSKRGSGTKGARSKSRKSGSGTRSGAAGRSKSKRGSKRRPQGANTASPTGRPNRKARRAHLQPAARR
jgi:superfamily II DNA/RNA helicase